jgi:hypothetical protein
MMSVAQKKIADVGKSENKVSARSSLANTIGSLKIEAGENWLPLLYQSKVRDLRTRAFRLDVPEKENKADIQYTLLGVELKVGKQRITCPDLATARFLQVFARIGVSEVAVPYDITKISVLADELESSWQRLLLLLENDAETVSEQAAHSRLRTALVKELRAEITEIGAGSAMPHFNQNTKQRKS